MAIIIPAAGLSKRFPNLRPKYSLTDYKGELMIENAFKPYLNKNKIFIGLNSNNEKKFSIRKYLKKKYNDKLKFIMINKLTQGPADTVSEILKKSKLSSSEEIFIKDCDTFFDHKIKKGNYVCVIDINNFKLSKNLTNKSYISFNSNKIVINIVEKKIISDMFCCGGYKFEKISEYLENFNELKKINHHKKEIFISHVIQRMISKKKLFSYQVVPSYTEVGTLNEWNDYNNKPCFFCDIDGTVIHAQPKQNYSKKPTPLKQNIILLKKFIKTGSQIFFTTSRPITEFSKTNRMLKNLGFNKFKLIMGVSNTKRVIINDYNEANPYPRAIAINLKRNNDNLTDFLKIL